MLPTFLNPRRSFALLSYLRVVLLLFTTCLSLLFFTDRVVGQTASAHLDNPFVGATFYRNVDYVASVNAAATLKGGVIGQQMRRVANYPTFLWLDSIAAVNGTAPYPRGLAGHLDQALLQGANAIGIVIYDLPNRDGSALSSNGELLIAQNGLNRYKTEYIDTIYSIISQSKYRGLRIVMVIEPDSLPNLITNLSFPRVAEANTSGAYVQGVQYAIGTLRALTNTYAYIDVAHAGWLGWPSNLTPFVNLLKHMGAGIPGGNGKVDGFISNTANYNVFVEPFMTADQQIGNNPVRSLAVWYDWNDHIEEQTYANALRTALITGTNAYPTSIGLLLDTSRNGWGGPSRPSAASTSTVLSTFVRATTLDKRIHKGNWGNQSGAGIGARPVANPAPNYDAFVWVKPPGESDGSSSLIPVGPENPDGKGFDRMCDPTYPGNTLNGKQFTGALANAPVSGRWFQSQFEQLVQNAFPAFTGNMSVAFAVTSTWATGYNAEVTMKNEGDAAVNGWTLEFDFPGTITNLWNGSITSHTGTHYVIQNAAYNATIAVGASAVVGFAADPADQAYPPTNYVFNGVAVGGNTTTPPTTTPPAISISDVTVTLTPAASGSGYLSTNGNQIVDSAGNPVRITGINWFGFETSNSVLHGLWARNYKSALDQIKTLGFNTLRIPYSNAMLRAGAATDSINYALNPDLQGLSPLLCLDKIIDYCGQIGLRIFLDRHSAKADGYLGENVWFISGDPYYTEQRWIDDWVMLANRYAGNPTVIGADLFNEPKRSATWGNSSPLTDWNKAAERCASAIQATNPNWLIIVEGVEQAGGKSYWWGGNLVSAAAFPISLTVPNKLVYSIHDYPASVSAQPWFSAGNYPQNLGPLWDSYWGYLFKNSNVPMLVGEFGSKLLTTSDQNWMDKLTDYMDGDFDLNGTNDLAAGKKGISWTMWCFNPNSGGTGGIVGDDWTTVNQTKLSYIQASMAPMLASASAAQSASFTVSLSSASSQSVSVAWSTASNTAIAGTDFTAASGTLTFAAGETSKTITVALLANNNLGDTKGFTVQLSTPVNATIADNSGIAAILPTTAWHSWLSSHFVASQLTNPALTAPNADPDLDGTSNLLEYATGTDPAKSDQPTTTLTKSISGLDFTYAKNKAAIDVTFAVEWSDTLSAPSWSTAGVGAPTILSGNGVTQQIKLSVPITSGGVTKRFMHLKVTKP